MVSGRALVQRVPPGPENRKPRRGNTGVFKTDDRCMGDSIAQGIKQHRLMIVQVDDFSRREVRTYAAVIGWIKLGSLFLTLSTRALTGHPERSKAVVPRLVLAFWG